MKRLFSVLVLTLALNFLLVGGAVGYLFGTGKLDKTKIGKVKELIFSPEAPTTQPSAAPANNAWAGSPLANFMAKQGITGVSSSGGTAMEQIAFLRRAFDTQMLELDQRQRQLQDLQRQVDLANQKLAEDRAALDKREKDLAQREQEAQKLQDDQGFQNSLALYNAMPAKQVKQIFMTLSENTVQQYLQAMDARTAGKIIKEFKTADETSFIQRVLERIRQSQLSSTDTGK
jgi:hypothetical protein